MTEDIKKLQDELQAAVKSLRDMGEQAEKERKQYGSEMAETKTALEKANAKINELETKLNRPGFTTPEQKTDTVAAEAKDAFMSWARKGAIAPEQLKVLTVSNDVTGGYLAPEDMIKEIIKEVTEYSPIRTLARVRPTSQRTVKVPVKTGTFAAKWVAEQGTKVETTGLAYGMQEIPTHELYAMVDISLNDLDDTAYNLEQELNFEFAEQFGVAEASAFLNGTGVGKPEGLMVASVVDSTVQGEASTLTSADGLIKLFHALKGVYANSGTWAMNRTTLGVLRTLKDTTNEYIWQPNVGLSTPPTILGRPYVECPEMDDIGANKYPILFGDFKKAYLIIDRQQIDVQRDPFTQATLGNVRFIARKRLGAQVVLSEAIRKLKIAAS